MSEREIEGGREKETDRERQREGDRERDEGQRECDSDRMTE